MRTLRPIALIAALAVATAGSAAAQRGTGSFRGGPGMGMGLRLLLEEDGLERFATRFELTDERRGQLNDLVGAFKNENSDVLDRLTKMQQEMRTLRSGDQRPTRKALREISDKYEHPGRALQPAFAKLQDDMLATLAPAQRRNWVRQMRRGMRTQGRLMGALRFAPRGWAAIGGRWRSMGPRSLRWWSAGRQFWHHGRHGRPMRPRRP